MRALRTVPVVLFAVAVPVVLFAVAGCASAPEPAPQPVPSPPFAPVAAPAPEVPAAMPKKPPYPATKRDAVVDVLHGVQVPDPYRWLEDEKSPEVQAWMKAQDGLTRAELARISERDAIAARLKELYYIDSLSAPVHRGARYFYSRRLATKEKAIVYWKEGKQGEEKVLLDPNEWSKDGTVALGTWVPSWDGKKVAYSVKANNSDEATLYVLDVATGKKSAIDVIEGAKYADPSWTPKGDGFYYTYLPLDPKVSVADRPGTAEVRFHRLGEDPKEDALVHEKTGDPTKFIGASLSRDGRFLVLAVSHGWSSTDVWFRDLKKKGKDAQQWVPLAVGRKAIFNVWAHQNRLFVSTNEDAPRWHVFRVDPAKPERKAWKEIVPERPDATLDGASIIGGKLVLAYLQNATSLLEIHDLEGKLVRPVQLPSVGSTFGPNGNEDEDEAWFGFTSFTTPPEIHETSIATGKSKLWSRVKVPVDPSPYTVEQVWYPSKDGTKVSMFLVHRKDLKKDGTTPCYLTGYGGFLISETPLFNAGIFPWLERGGMFALPNLRGGGEYGETWHQQGMLLNKQNTFDDFIGAAEFLIRERYTRPEKLAISGGSNGGLLMGAAMTQRPELFAVVVCAVPLLDMVRYHLYGSGKTWISEYGSAEDPEQFKAIFAYSPYHHVKPSTRYPALLMDAADSDDRVDPMHARKFIAAIQEATADKPALLRIEPHAGHGGADLVRQAVERGADRWAFVLWQLGLVQVPAAATAAPTNPAPPPVPAVPAAGAR